jgi:hypothetical protein
LPLLDKPLGEALKSQYFQRFAIAKMGSATLYTGQKIGGFFRRTLRCQRIGQSPIFLSLNPF